MMNPIVKYKRKRLFLNTAKCNVVSFPAALWTKYDYKFNNQQIPRFSPFKDLGVLFDSKFSLLTHIELIANKLLQSLGFISRNLHYFSNISTCLTLHNFYVKSKLEFREVSSTIFFTARMEHILLMTILKLNHWVVFLQKSWRKAAISQNS